MNNVLPDKPSELIRVALGDLEKVEQDPRYKIEMGSWVRAKNDGSCAVCLAGATLVKTMNLPMGVSIKPHTTIYPIRRKLFALDHFRLGYISNGLSHMGYKKPLIVKRNHVHYAKDPVQFKQQMNQLANDLEAAGL